MRRGRRSAVLHHRMVWQGAALLLARPDGEYAGRLETVAEMLGHLDGVFAMPLGRALADLQSYDVVEARRAHAGIDRDLRLASWTAATTRERAVDVLAFTNAYRAAGVARPAGAVHDHLAVVLEFAAHVDPEAGRRLLVRHRVAIAALARTVADAGSPYAHVLTAVCATLPKVGTDQVDALLNAGSSAEGLGVQAILPD